jgi:hypothetical protein
MSQGCAAGIGGLLFVQIPEHGYGGFLKEKRLVRPIQFLQALKNNRVILRRQFGQLLYDLNHAHNIKLPWRVTLGKIEKCHLARITNV